MKPGFKKFLQSWAINTLAVLVAVSILPGIHYKQPLDLFVASLLLGILNAFLRPIMMLLALPLLIFTLGLFMLVINALILYFVGYVLRPHFYVDGFWSAFWGALIIGIISLLLNTLSGGGGSRVEFRRSRRPPDSKRDGGGSGPVIDV
jgi:putative membrane protein